MDYFRRNSKKSSSEQLLFSLLFSKWFFVFLYFVVPVSGNPFYANMTGADMTEAVPETYVGSAVLNIADTGRIDYKFTQSGVDQILDITLQTPREGDRLNGVVLFSFNLTQSSLAHLNTNGSDEGYIMANRSQAIGVIQKPGIFYISVKTTRFSIAAIKGFLKDVIPSPVDGKIPTYVLQANMTAEAVTPIQGPEFGYATSTFSLFDAGDLTWLMQYDFLKLNFTGVKTVGWYSALAGSNGPLLVNFTTHIDLLAFSDNQFTRGYLNVTKVVMQPILAGLDNVYSQISTTDYPKGIVRGQLFLSQFNDDVPSPTSASVIYAKTPPPPSGSFRRSCPQWTTFFSTVLVFWGALLLK